MLATEATAVPSEEQEVPRINLNENYLHQAYQPNIADNNVDVMSNGSAVAQPPFDLLNGSKGCAPWLPAGPRNGFDVNVSLGDYFWRRPYHFAAPGVNTQICFVKLLGGESDGSHS